MLGLPESRSRSPRFLEFAKRVDHYFLSDAARNQSVQNIANTRMGLIVSLAYGASVLALTPMQSTLWPPSAVGGFLVLGLATIGLPFALRQTTAIRLLGHIVCANITIYLFVMLWMSAGRASGILIVIPLMPMLALLTQRGRPTLAWGAIPLGLLTLGAGLIRFGSEPVVAYSGPSMPILYSIATVSTLAMLGVTFFFDRFWNSTVIKVANRARAQLIEREERYSSLLEHGSEGIMVVDETTRITFANSAAERLVGFDVGQAVGRKLRHLCDPEDVRFYAPVWERVLATPDAIGHMCIRTRAGLGPDGRGEAKTLELTLCNCLENSAVRGIVIHEHDITDLTRAEANYETLIEQSLQGIAVICDGRVVYANQALADLFEIPREDLLGPINEDSLASIHRDDRERLKQAFESSDGNPTGVVEARRMLADGSWGWMQTRWDDCVWEGRPARQAVYADITAQKELEARNEREHERLEARIRDRTFELEKSQRSLREKERLAAIGTLAAGMAHQINNPIGAILAAAEFATLVEHDEDSERIQSDALLEIRNQAIRCGKIVRSILQFSRAEPTEKWSSNISSVLHAAVGVTNHYAKQRSATVELDLSREAAEQSVRMNPIELEQVFVNLLRNALESQPGGAAVKIKTRLIDQFIEITVEDDGPGVSVTDASHIFEPFYTTRLREGGSGLGLSVAHGIIEDHSGQMWLANPTRSDEIGARFHVKLPVEKPDSEISS